MANKSLVWSYFLKDLNDESKVHCCVCSAVIVRGCLVKKNFNTTNMINHLRANHKDEFNKFDAATKEKEKKQAAAVALAKESCSSSHSSAKYFRNVFRKKPPTGV